MSTPDSTPPEKSITILAGNIRGAHKESRLQYGMKSAYDKAGQPDIVLCSETWSNETFCINNKFANYQNGDEAQIGTGMMTAIDREISHKVKNHSNRLQLIQLMHLMNIIHLYAPHCGKDFLDKEEFKEELTTLVEEITNDRPILFIGDFNIDKKDLNQSYLNKEVEKGTIISTGKPTQSFGRELDYCICFNKNNELEFDTTAELISLPTSDHDAILVKLKSNFTNIKEKEIIVMEEVEKRSKIPVPKTEHQKSKFKAIFHKKMNKFLYDNPKVKSILTQKSNLICSCRKGNHQNLINQAYEGLRESIITAAAAAVPTTKNQKTKNRTNKNDFDKLYDLYLEEKINKRVFKRRLKILQKKRNKKYFKNMVSHVRDSKLFFKLAKAKLNADKSAAKVTKMPFPKIIEMYRKIFEPNDFSTADLLKLRKEYKSKTANNSTFKPYTLQEISEAYKLINRNKASRGPTIELWLMADANQHTTDLFNAFQRHGHIPKQFLTAEITMLKKCHLLANSDHTNYRPIALIESLSKVFEAVLRERIPWSITKYQYAYQKKVGCLNAIKDFRKTANHYLVQNEICINVFLDMSKAFDKLCIKATLKSLEPLLSNDLPTLRIMAVMLTGAVSVFNNNYTITPRCGIRQGSLISPFLFLQACNEWLDTVGNSVGGTLKAFADDIALQTASFIWAQSTLNSFEVFCRKKSLLANPKKSGIILMTSGNMFNFFAGGDGIRTPKLFLGSDEIKLVSSYKYLGYHISGCNSDKRHLKEVFSKLRKKALNLRRYMRWSNDFLRVKLINSFLLPTLYGLEFSEKINQQYTSRYNYIMSIAFGIDTKRIQEKLLKYPDLELESVAEKARNRYENITSRCDYITL